MTGPTPLLLRRRRRLVALLAGAGLLAAAVPAAAATGRDPDESAALVLLGEAAEASRTLTYAGTQYVATWGPATTALVEVEHAPGRGASVRTTNQGDPADPVLLEPTPLDDELLDVLGDRYELRIAGDGHCAGRAAQVVEARRPGRTGPAAVAGRFWVDRDSGLVLRREVFDTDGGRLRSSAFLDLVLEPSAPAPRPGVAAASLLRRGDGDAGRLSRSALRRMRADGWVVPEQLPEGFALFAARVQEHDGAKVLHASYSDGLSTTSLFSQPGRLGSTPPEGFGADTMAGEPVWASEGAPRRVVWAGGGRVWTLVSDAPADSVARAVAVLPRAALPDVDRGWRARLARGAGRLAGALNPFS